MVVPNGIGHKDLSFYFLSLVIVVVSILLSNSPVGALKSVAVNSAKSPAKLSENDPNLQRTNATCGKLLYNGTLYVVKDDTVTLYEICFNEDKASAIYTEHSINLAGIEKEKSEHRKFKEKYTLAGWKPTKVDQLYTAANQKKFFDTKFLPFTQAGRYYFSRNHLTPHADFVLTKHQVLTYYFQNCFPGLDTMNAQNWRKVEYYTRLISVELKVRLRIFTGNFGILMKKTKKDSKKISKVYLDLTNERIEVPSLVWKLVINVSTQAAITFLTSNDPSTDQKDLVKFSALCESKCDTLGYKFNQAIPAGRTLCCSYEDFSKHVKFLPIQLKKNTALLANPKPR